MYAVEHRQLEDGRVVRLLVPVGLDREPQGWRAYDLKREPALFRRFADLPVPLPDANAIHFADEYGPLGLVGAAAEEFGLPALGPAVEGAHPIRNLQLLLAESLSHWEREIRELRILVDLWLALRTEDKTALAELRPRLLDEANFSEGMPEPPGMLLSLREVQEFIAAQVQGHANRGTDVGASGELIVVPSADDPVAFNVGYSAPLIDKLWEQFAHALVRRPDYVRCLECDRWIEVARGSATVRREFCSAKCRSADARARQRKARALHESGTPLGEIAEQVGSAPATVQRWLEAPKRRRRQ